MDEWLRELRSSPDEGAVRGGERQARAAFRLVNRDPTVKRLILVEALALTGLWLVFFLLRREAGWVGRDGDRVFEEWLYWVSAAGIATVCSVAVACAVDARIDGAGSDLRAAFGEVRRRLPGVLGWWLISIAALAALGFGTRAVMSPLAALFVVSLVWGVGTLFVVPAIALQGDGPIAALGEALRLLRARWGRTLAGLFAIGFVAGLVFIACGFMLKATAENHPRTTDESVWRFGGPLLLFYLAYGLMAATRVGFAVVLARDALDDLPGEPPAVKPRGRAAKVRRVVFGALGLLAVLIVVSALLFHPHSNNRSTTSQTYVAAPTAPASHPLVFEAGDFEMPIEDPRAAQLLPGAPVMLGEETIGRIKMVHVERPSLVEAFFEVDPRLEDIAFRSPKKVVVRGGRAYVLIVPRGTLGRAPSPIN